MLYITSYQFFFITNFRKFLSHLLFLLFAIYCIQCQLCIFKKKKDPKELSKKNLFFILLGFLLWMLK